jgi:5-amino-6-(5-phospho-D-ribitylamino)uracil phosphatase
MRQAISLIASDIDGTLLDPAGTLPQANARALREAHARGVRVALASIRKRDSSAHIAELLGVPCILITQGGALIYDEAGATLHESPIQLELAREIARFADRERLPLMATVDEFNLYRPESHPRIDMRYISGSDVPSLAEALHAPPSRLIVRGQAGYDALFAAFGDAPLRWVRHFSADGSLYDAVLTHTDATKETALGFVCDRLGIAPGAALALGDAEADIGMLRLAGVGVAMGNARADVRAVADWVAPTAAEAGVAAALARFVFD